MDYRFSALAVNIETQLELQIELQFYVEFYRVLQIIYNEFN